MGTTHTRRLFLSSIFLLSILLLGLIAPHAEAYNNRLPLPPRPAVLFGERFTSSLSQNRQELNMLASTTRDQREKNASSTSGMRDRNASSTRGSTLDLTCTQTAVDARELAIEDGWTALSGAIASGLSARSAALHDAWGMTDGKARNQAILNAWKTWRTTDKAAHTDIKKARKAAWDTYKTTMKNTCKTSVPKDEALGKDTVGSMSL